MHHITAADAAKAGPFCRSNIDAHPHFCLGKCPPARVSHMPFCLCWQARIHYLPTCMQKLCAALWCDMESVAPMQLPIAAVLMPALLHCWMTCATAC